MQPNQKQIMDIMKKCCFYCFILLLLLSTNNLNAQYSPYFQNFSLSEYNAGNQNWGLTKSAEGKLYVANNEGLLEFDGLKWSFYELPNKTTIRSVYAFDNKIFTGSYEEFGYWENNNKGLLEYVSLSKNIDQQEFLNEEFWEILYFNNSIIFRSFSSIYIYKDEKITKIAPPSIVLSCDVVDDKLFVSTLINGILTLENNQLKTEINDELLIGTKVISITKFKNKYLIATSLKGLYLYENKKLKPWDSEINGLIKKHQLNSFSKLKNGNMIFGTIKNGVYVTNALGKIIFNINKENGLINNTILSQYVDSDDELWVGLDNGIAKVNLNDHHSFYNDITGKLGAVYDVKLYNNTMYIGSNTGLYFLDKNNNLQFVEGSQGQVWELKEINGELFCGHNNGTYLVKKDKIRLISNYTGGWVIKKVPEESNTYIQGTYGGLVKFSYNNNTWKAKHLGKTTMPIRFLVFEDENTAWAAHAYSGLYRIKFDSNHNSITEIKNYGNKGLWSDFNVRIYKLKNDICFKTNNGWQKYEPLLDSIIPFKLLNESLGKETYIISKDASNRLAVKSGDAINFKSFAKDEPNLLLTNKYFKNRLIVGYEKISNVSDSIYSLNLIDGFMLIDGNQSSRQSKLYKPQIEKVEANNTLLDLSSLNNIELPYRDSNINISLSSPLSNNHYFEYAIPRLDVVKWNRIEKEKINLSNLSNGDYEILFRTVNDFGEVSSNESMSFEVLPPWYKGSLGFALYTFLAMLTILIVYFLHKRKIKKEHKLLLLKYQNEQKLLLREKTIENDKKIVHLKNESLKNEVKLKSKQLANTAMALVKKNETLLEIKKGLVQNKNSFDDYYSYKKILKKIENSIGHEDEWDVFEYNFNQVHEEFFNRLKTDHPNLTGKDLKIAAYIKMNLSTKEIAPLMNISVRGVETHRYRLKKKFNLENDVSVTNYLLNFK